MREGGGGGCSVKGWFPSGAQASSQSIWLKGVWLNYTQRLGPAPRHSPARKTNRNRLWRVNGGCEYVHHTWGTLVHLPHAKKDVSLSPLTAPSVSSSCLRGQVICVTRDWVGETVGSPGTGSCPLQSTAWILVGIGSQRSVLISLMPEEKTEQPGWEVIEDACVCMSPCRLVRVHVLEERSRALVVTEGNYKG